MYKPAARRRVGAEVAKQLRALILGGRFEPGDKLPPERALAQMLNVNRASLREGLKELELSGLVRTRQGDGTRVLDYRQTAGLELLEHLLPHELSRGLGEGGPRALRDLLEFRQSLGRELARLAAERATDAQLAELEAIAARRPQTPGEVLRQDFEFYDRLNPGNLVFVLIMNTVRDLVIQYSDIISDFNPPAEQVWAHHEEVLAALHARDADAAFRAADRHLRRGKEHLLSKWRVMAEASDGASASASASDGASDDASDSDDDDGATGDPPQTEDPR